MGDWWGKMSAPGVAALLLRDVRGIRAVDFDQRLGGGVAGAVAVGLLVVTKRDIWRGKSGAVVAAVEVEV